ncbi:MAG: hypothetical protein C0413_03100 [Clostridiales bacterium]|nr:hypothetical protein [Clostridiales bacterium]
MKKKLMTLLVCVLLLVMVIPGVANAQGNDAAPIEAGFGSQGDYSNAQFEALEHMVANANRQIENAVKAAQQTPVNDVDRLLERVNAIVESVFAYADSIGAVVVCEYTTYYIDGQYVLIDPLRVIPL